MLSLCCLFAQIMLKICFLTYIRPNKKRSLLRLTRPTVVWSADRTLFSDFASDTFWRRSVRGQLRRRSRSREASGKSTSKIKQRQGDLDCWPRLLCRDPGAHGDVRRDSIDATWFLSAAANRASFSLLAILLLQLRNLTCRWFFTILADSLSPSYLAVSRQRWCQLQSTSPRTRNLSADFFCTWTRMSHCSRCCGLRLEKTSLCSRFAFKTPVTWRSRRRPALTSLSNMIQWSSSRRISRERTRARARYTKIYVDNHPHARPGWLWQRRSSGREAQLLFPALEKYRLAYRICV